MDAKSPAGMTNIVVVSPHLDDALLSCGELLARCGGASVVTLFAGAPADYEVVTRLGTERAALHQGKTLLLRAAKRTSVP